MPSVKESFIEYLKTKSKPNSGKPNSYAKAMEVLEEVIFSKKLLKEISIWTFINSKNIDDIYNFVLEQQQKNDGIFKDYTPSSYWKAGYCSAALKEFSEFLRKDSETLQEKNNYQRYHDSSLVSFSKNFILLAGISGTGKTRFVKRQAEACGKDKNNYCLVSVRPDWHEPSDLLGYVSRLSGKPEYISTKVLDFIIRAWMVIAPAADGNGTGELDLSAIPYWLCLDEMNLAPVEQYFADYLSVLETRQFEDGKYFCEALLDKYLLKDLDRDSEIDLQTTLGLGEHDALWQYFLNFGISLPPNLIVAGTVNMDETTHGFSRKVIDRALTIDFGEFFPNDYASFFDQECQTKTLTYSMLTQAKKGDLSASIDADGRKSIEFLDAVNTVLKRSPFELAYRALNELLLQVACSKPRTDAQLQAVWDDFLMTKVLPRIDGDEDKLRYLNGDSDNNLLEELAVLLESKLDEIWMSSRMDFYREKKDGSVIDDIKCRSKAKLEWMKNRLEINTFTSFWP